MHRIDHRLGGETGVSGTYADVPVFQIINDAHDAVLHFTGQVTDLKYGASGSSLRQSANWPEIEARKIEFNLRNNKLAGNALEAVRLIEEVRAFAENALTPLLAKRGQHP